MNTYKYLIVLLVALCFSNSTYAQNFVYGKVVDEGNQAMISAEVYWKTRIETDRNKKLTGADGTFKIELPKGRDTTLVIKFPGYEEVVKNLSAAEYNEFILIEMKKKGVTSVTASRWEQSVYDVPASTVIITRQEIAQNGYMTLQEILENVPGLFTIDHRTENGISIGVRGFWSDVNRNVMIQVNGVNMVSERRNYYSFEAINMAIEAIEKIEIVRGPMNVIYGAGAFFGVINIITKDNQNQDNGIIATGFGLQSKNNDAVLGGFRYSGSDFSIIQKNFIRYAGGGEGLNFSFNAMTYRRDGVGELFSDMIKSDYTDPTPGYPNWVTGETLKKDTILPDRWSKKHQALNVSASYKGFFVDVNFAATNLGHSAWNSPGPGARNDLKYKTGNYQFGYTGSTRSDRFSYQAKVAYMKTNSEGEYKYYDDSLFSFGEDRASTVRTEVNTRTSLKKSDDPADLQIDLLTGLYFSRNLENNSYYNLPEIKNRNWYTGLAPDSHVDTKAAYLQTEVKYENWIIVGGVRLEHEMGYDILDFKNSEFKDSINEFELGGAPSDTDNFISSSVRRHKPGAPKPRFAPRLAVIYKIPSSEKGVSHYFKGMYGLAYREPNPVLNAFDIMRSNYDNENGGPNVDTNWVHLDYLKAEKVSTYELGYTLVNEAVGMEVNANFFLNDLEDLLARETHKNGKGEFIGVSKNSGKMRTYGVELIAKRRFSIPLKNEKKIGLNTNLSISYQETKTRFNEDNDNGEEAKDFVPRKVSFSPQLLGTVNVIAIYDRFSLGIGGNYVGEMNAFYSDSKVDDNGVLDPGYIGDSTAGYFRLSMNVRFDNIRFFDELRGGFYFNFKVSNLLNKQYKYPTYSSVAWAQRGILGRSRQFLISIGYEF
jgi:outer membrane receptor protein involved in Fe transport